MALNVLSAKGDKMIFKIGDLVKWSDGDHDGTTGIVLKVISDVEIPSLIEVLWSPGDGHFHGTVTRVYADDLAIIN